MVLVKLSPRPAGQQDDLVLRHGDHPVVISSSGQEEVALLGGDEGRPVRPVSLIVRVHHTLGLQAGGQEDQEEADSDEADLELLHPC